MTEIQEDRVGALPTPALVEHIRARCHDTQRHALPGLIALAQRVETRHAVDPDAPHGLTQALRMLSGALADHLRHEEPVLSAAQDAGSTAQATPGLDRLRRDHDELEAQMNHVAATTHGFRLPGHADAEWRRLYAEVGQMVEDLEAQMLLENEVLFARLETVD